MNSARIQNTVGGVTLKPSLPLDYRRCRSSVFQEDSTVSMCKGLNVSLDFAVNAADCVFKRMQLPRDHREKQQHGMLKQNGNERFYQFFFLPVWQKPTPPTGREMNSPRAVIPESPLLFLIKTFLCLCTSPPPTHPPPPRRSGGGWITCSWQVTQWHRTY